MWFTEDALTPGAVFSAAGLMLCLSGWNSGLRRRALAGAALLVVAGSAFAVDQLVVTERERLEARVHALCDDFRRKEPATVEYFSPNAPGLRASVGLAMALVTIESGPRLTDFDVRLKNGGTRATSHFRANAVISVQGAGHVGHQPSRFILTWQREDDAWKIINVQRMHPHRNEELGLLDQAAG